MKDTFWNICLFLNPLSAKPGYIRYFRKILPFLLKSRFLLLSLHRYTKWICRFDSPLKSFFFIKFLVIFKKCSALKGLIINESFHAKNISLQITMKQKYLLNCLSTSCLSCQLIYKLYSNNVNKNYKEKMKNKK